MTTPLLQVQGLRTRFGDTTAVDGVDLTVHRGTILGVVGESGSGKSVTARSVMRLLRSPGRVAEGTVAFDGEDLLALPDRRMRRLRGGRIAMVFQDPQSALNPVRTVGDQIAEALTAHGATRTAARARAAHLLGLVGIPDGPNRLDDYPHQFSGGMRQRVVIAIALANEPDLLIADEPTTALDVTIRAQILALLARLRDELGVAIVVITHDMGVVAELCDEVVVMYAGRVAEHGTVEQVLSAPRHPYTANLLRAMPRLDAVPAARLTAIPGTPPDPADLPAGCAFAPRCAQSTDVCAQQRPALRAVDGREVACWHAADSAVVAAPVPAAPRPPVGATVLAVEDLRVDLAGRSRLWRPATPVYAVDGVSLHVAAGETLGLVGESGCGKSSLAKAIVGLNPITSGTVRVDGTPADPARGGVRGAVQYVFQDPYASLNPRRTVGQSMAEALRAGGTPADQTRERAAQLLATVGLTAAHLDRYPHAFSGGQRQRIGIARALATNPRVLLCDEPVSALDVSVQAQVINLLADLRDELGLGYLFIAHDLAVVRHLADRVAVMYLGRIVETGPAEQVYAEPQHPYTAALLSSSPEPTPGLRRERIVLTGDLPSPKNPPTGCRFRTRCPAGPLHRPDRQICVDVDPRLSTDAHTAACHFPGQLR
ncbi:ABC transporter ATP-binding protein [Catellatospora sp. IY07-71]|uniref:dipeptide ABC transporter ATP-binding protein n=1 Tax=Catellatospora sp. IY07-71 TaxID=2728827 RepID=UPI001BB3673C|nr:ABC transporter ATP-binding protein [Catellatospora sp. IY07-71]BCJ75179.1 ABC transporter ATP-binding protein [Catellatospora sp. IY07-71]